MQSIGGVGADEGVLRAAIYPQKVDMKGLSKMKSLVVEQMLSTVLTEVITRFKSRCIKL